jgi:hypothetical protein
MVYVSHSKASVGQTNSLVRATTLINYGDYSVGRVICVKRSYFLLEFEGLTYGLFCPAQLPKSFLCLGQKTFNQEYQLAV